LLRNTANAIYKRGWDKAFQLQEDEGLGGGEDTEIETNGEADK